VESQTNTPPDQLNVGPDLSKSSSGISRFFVFGLKRGCSDQNGIQLPLCRLIHHLKNLTYCFKIAIPSPILENRQFSFSVAKPIPLLRGSGKGFSTIGVFPANSTFLAYSK
jgi:hypothetical protein